MAGDVGVGLGHDTRPAHPDARLESIVAVSVAVVDTVPAFRHGLEAALGEAGFAVARPTDIDAWADSSRAVVVVLRTAADRQIVRRLTRAAPELVCSVVVQDETPAAFADAIRLGASACVSWTSDVEDIIDSLANALRGRSLLTVETLRWMAARLPESTQADLLPPEDVGRLRALASGDTIGAIAERAGYSERTMYRLLQDLYGRLRVNNRREAIALAYEWGVLP
ncbi:MAG TPA: hypothetical protein VK906_17340 [Egicoccus sp.]|nr:hypothetical protein [Egicoccus sp.]HSK24953.1 hypothetical protein [Egicoccus sp.]